MHLNLQACARSLLTTLTLVNLFGNERSNCGRCRQSGAFLFSGSHFQCRRA